MKKKGFTLIELIISISIIAILGSILVPNISSYVTKAKDQKAKNIGALIFSSSMRSYMKEDKFDKEKVQDNISEDLNVRDVEVNVENPIDDNTLNVDFKCNNLNYEVEINGRKATYVFNKK